MVGSQGGAIFHDKLHSKGREDGYNNGAFRRKDIELVPLWEPQVLMVT